MWHICWTQKCNFEFIFAKHLIKSHDRRREDVYEIFRIVYREIYKKDGTYHQWLEKYCVWLILRFCISWVACHSSAWTIFTIMLIGKQCILMYKKQTKSFFRINSKYRFLHFIKCDVERAMHPYSRITLMVIFNAN